MEIWWAHVVNKFDFLPGDVLSWSVKECNDTWIDAAVGISDRNGTELDWTNYPKRPSSGSPWPSTRTGYVPTGWSGWPELQQHLLQNKSWWIQGWNSWNSSHFDPVLADVCILTLIKNRVLQTFLTHQICRRASFHDPDSGCWTPYFIRPT